MTNELTSHKASIGNARGESIHKTGPPSIRLQDLPQDILYTIVSKLPPRQFARTSVLSSKWRCMWSVCPRLTFDGVAVCKCCRDDLLWNTGLFINEVNGVLQKHQGKVVETLEVKIDFLGSILARHLNDWVAFAATSRTRNITLDLKPISSFWGYVDRYVFPFELLGNGSISCLQNIQLSFVSMKPPAEFRGFRNLKKLHIQLLHISRKDFEHMLSHCYSLEWLNIDRCVLNYDLIVNSPLSCLRFLRIEYCEFTKIEFHAMNLATFEYIGPFIPIHLMGSSELSADIRFDSYVFQHVLVSFLNGLLSVQSLTLRIGLIELEERWLWDNPLKFPYLRNLQLFLFICPINVDRILYLLCFLRATPYIEDLKVHFAGRSLWLADVGPRRHELGRCNEYNYLKNVTITGFKAARGQVELLLHVVENAPALQVVTVDTTEPEGVWSCARTRPLSFSEEAKRSARACLSRLSQDVKTYVY